MSKSWNPFSVKVISILLPGSGYLFCGKPGKALIAFSSLLLLAFFGAFIGFASFVGTVVTLIIALALQFFFIIHSSIHYRKMEKKIKQFYNRGYFIVILFIIAYFGSSFIENFFISNFVRYKTYSIPFNGMQPALFVGDRIVVDCWAYNKLKPKHQDIIVLQTPGDNRNLQIRRCIGVPGDVIEVKDNITILNNSIVTGNFSTYTDPDYPDSNSKMIRPFTGPIRLESNQYYLLGDNRNSSMDSRDWGPIELSCIKGKILYIYWSKDFKRIGMDLTGR